ncbi:transmembrane protein [Mycolicibacter heraklionensis]|uniref:Transmembrane protein n=1 Tax=Mycolicibacter heraklionensis TaxID=512402 RepID=A0ABR5FEE3_9MYCO|nr:transmembrane protein [Mycolicibacter heraklionensis]KLO28286.1 transmembrane protein [Mycolicibacter heraklionensis]
MSGPKPDPRDVETRPISVAELLAKNGNIGSPPVTGRRRRRRGNADAVTVAELTGEIPIIRDEAPPEPEVSAPSSASTDSEPSGALPIGPAPGFVDEDRPVTGPRPAQRVESGKRPAAEPRWPKSPPQAAPRGSGPEQSAYPRPMRRSDPPVAENGQPAETRPAGSGAERMRPDPVDTYTDLAVDVMAGDVRDADLPTGDSAFVRSFLTKARSTDRAGGALVADADAEDAGADSAAAAEAETADQYLGRPGVVGGALVVLQSILAVAFGGGLFIAFDQLWRWNSIVALVLTVLVTLGLVAAVQAVRKTVDIVSTLIAVAVGLLVTLGPLALHAN